VAAGDAHLFEVRPAVQWLADAQKGVTIAGAKHFRGQNPARGATISYYLPNDLGERVQITITTPDGEIFRNLSGSGDRGINRVQWNLRGNMPPEDPDQPRARRQPPMAAPGTYLVTMVVGGQEMVQSIQVLEDIWMNETH
jgi:hypothetical protein